MIKPVSLFYILIGWVLCVPCYAYEWDNGGLEAPMISGDYYRSVSSYESSVYTPFSNEVRGSESSTGGKRKAQSSYNGFITPDEPNRSDESPVGSPYILLLLAGAWAAGVGIRQARRRTLRNRNH